MSEEFKNVESLVDQLRSYVNTRVAQTKLSVAEKASRLAAAMIAFVLAALVFFLFLVLLSMAVAIALGQWLGNMWLGYLIVAGLVLLLTGIIWLAKDRLIRIPLMNALLKSMFDKEEDDDDEED
ncbi:MAG: phage holin family protein [Chitinophagaceae bacterium]